MKFGPQFEAAWSRRWSNSAWPLPSSLAVTLLIAVAIPLCAQNSRVFRDGNSWVEETTGAIPAGREFRAQTPVGSFQVQGSAAQVTYVVRKRSFANSEEEARKQFQQLKFSVNKAGDAVVHGRQADRP